MKILVCENRIEPMSGHEICLSNMKEYLEKNYNCSFEKKEVEKDVIYVYEEKENFICIRTVKKDPEWIKNTCEIINDFCTSYKDGFLVMHLGLNSVDKANYYNYSSIRALSSSKIKANHVIVYSTVNFSARQFYEETSYEYNLIKTRDLETLLKKVQDICTKRTTL